MSNRKDGDDFFSSRFFTRIYFLLLLKKQRKTKKLEKLKKIKTL